MFHAQPLTFLSRRLSDALFTSNLQLLLARSHPNFRHATLSAATLISSYVVEYFIRSSKRSVGGSFLSNIT